MQRWLLLVALFLCACSAPSSKRTTNLFFDPRLFFDVETEVERVPCAVQGQIPSWISGTLLRNGPAKFHVGNTQVDYFDGLAMLNAFEFSSDQVLYTNRFIRSELYYIMMEEKSLDFDRFFAQDPCPKVFKNQVSRFIPQNMKGIPNANVNILEYADQMVAVTELPLPVLFNPVTLTTTGSFHYNDRISEGQWESAHAQHDPVAGEMVNYFIQFGQTNSYVIWKMKDHQASRQVVAQIPVQLPAYMHSFAMTERYVVLVEFPFVVNPLDLMSKKKAFIFNYKWRPDLGTNFIVVDRSTGQVAMKVKGAPFFAFHHVNAFDQDNQIVMDIVTYANADIIESIVNPAVQQSYIDKSQNTKLERFTIDVRTQKLSRETLFPKLLELPRIADNLTAQEYRYCYAHRPLSLKDDAGLYKIDVVSKTAKNWSEKGCVPGEPIFVPRPGGQAEDDGAVLSLVLDYVNHRSFLLILDAKDFTEMARAEAPHAIPEGIHGLWKQVK